MRPRYATFSKQSTNEGNIISDLNDDEDVVGDDDDVTWRGG